MNKLFESWRPEKGEMDSPMNNSATSLLCPFCLNTIPYDSEFCPITECGEEIPNGYRNISIRLSPTVIGAVGLQSHGKTLFLASLYHSIKQMSKVWTGFYMQALNGESLKTVRENADLLQRGYLPTATAKNYRRPSIQLLRSIPYFREKLLLIYDTSGENFEEDKDIERRASYTASARCIFLLVSIDQLEKEGEESDIADNLDRMLNIFMLGMDRLKKETLEQWLIVVFTKGDQLESHFSEYPDVWEYIQTSELDAYQIDLEQYIQKMSVISERLKTFSQETLGAYAFYNMAIDRFARVEFCLTSALGSQPEGETLSARISPRRITDPLLWAMLSTQTTPINRR